MATSAQRRLNPSEVRRYGSGRDQHLTPDLTEIQTKSYAEFLQQGADSEKRKDQGIEGVLQGLGVRPAERALVGEHLPLVVSGQAELGEEARALEPLARGRLEPLAHHTAHLRMVVDRLPRGQRKRDGQPRVLDTWRGVVGRDDPILQMPFAMRTRRLLRQFFRTSWVA